MSQQRNPVRPHPDFGTLRAPRPHERTAPAITREAPWFAHNASTVPLSPDGPPFGPTRFLLGANVPWVHYGLDVGSSPWRPEGGLHAHAEDAALLRQVFQRLRADGVQNARFFVLADGRAGVRFDAEGTPEGLDGAVFPDLEVVLEAARAAGLGLVLVLLDTGWSAPPTTVDGHPIRGHGATLRDPAKRAALLERVLRPLLIRFGDHPAVVAWEVLAMADLCVAGLDPAPAARRSVSGLLRRWTGVEPSSVESTSQPGREEMRNFLGEALSLVRRHTRALGTASVSRWSSLGLVRGLGMDVYAVGWPADESELRLAVSDLRLDRPLLLTSFPGAHPHKSIKTLLDGARCSGYGGAFVWSVLRHDAASGYDGQVPQWVRNHHGHLHRRDVPAVEPAAPARTDTPSETPASTPLVLQR